MVRFQVDSTEVAAAAARTRTSSGVIRGEVAAMMGHLGQLQTAWTGQAAAAFGACAEQWRATQGQVEATLEQITLALDSASRTYAEAEQAAHSLFSG
ncbi:WXG100 family type VII secretion target [Georgenia sp. 10Sc9-8]|uniref:ESAT-6-like protein n=1 Tax=Georgenia halotolerans TaxID=3028317 RepID=A0ABT5TWC4_9MICO|nr:WXG100 family type VII secretion target [Georgenia halotolerans]